MTAGSSSAIEYPDNGNLLEDASMLRNAVQFTTAQRAFSADLLLRQLLTELDERTVRFEAVDAFCAEITATEDVLA